MIDGYNNGAFTSKKRILEDRKQYLDEYWGDSLDDFTKRKLVLYDLIYRLSNSNEDKYLSFFKDLCVNLSALGIKEPDNDKRIKILKEIYDIYERTSIKEDPYLEFSHEIEKSYSSMHKISTQNQALKGIYRLLEDIKAQKHKILASGVRDPQNNEILLEYPDEYHYKNPITLDELEKEVIVEDFYQPKEPKIKEKKVNTKQEKDSLMEIGIDRFENLENHFKDFMEKYDGMIKTNREFWQMNMVEILTDINSEKNDHEIFDGLIARLFNDDYKKEKAETLANEAAEFLLKHRKEIKLMCKIRKVFEKESPEHKGKKDKAEFNKPTNFKVNKGKPMVDEEYIQANEDVMLVDNYQILSKIIVFF